MKWLIYGVLAIVTMMFVLPETGSAELRNIPLLLTVILLIVLFNLLRFFKYIGFMLKVKKSLIRQGMRIVKLNISPFESGLRGHYSIIAQDGRASYNILVLVKKIKYSHCFFVRTDSIEFYKHTRAAYKSGKGAGISKRVETKLVGRQKISRKISRSACGEVNILLFDKFPAKVSDSVKRAELGNGDRICESDVYLYDFCGFMKFAGHGAVA